MKELFNLGDLYVSDFIADGEEPRGGREPLKLVLDETVGAPRLEKPTDPDAMYGKYWYRSGINATMTAELKSIAEELPNLIPTEEGDVWLDIACNDGTLLKHVDNKFKKVGIDPADDTFINESRNVADAVVQDYFSADAYNSTKFVLQRAKIITCIAMFYDVDDPIPFLEDVRDTLDVDGLFVVQMSYTPLMLRQLAFDNICHEHVWYYSLSSIKRLFNRVGLQIVDCKLNDINGGSFRVYARHKIADPTTFRTAPFRDVANFRIDSLLGLEDDIQITKPWPYLSFYRDICDLRDETVAFIRKVRAEGKTVWGYGASTKGNTLLQWYGLTAADITGIAERSPYKFGLKTVGTGIPIFSEEETRAAKPDYMLVLPWHFISEFRKREADYLNGGGQFIVPCPRFGIIGA
jgi:hypothetical protein